MKHRTKDAHRLPHVQAVIDRLRALGAEIVDVLPGRVVEIVFAVARWVEQIRVPSHPRRAEACARARCAKADALCARHVRTVAC